jgi:hypothetical protein
MSRPARCGANFLSNLIFRALPATDAILPQKFYAALFPSWDFKPATKQYTEDKIAMWSFAGPSGEPPHSFDSPPPVEPRVYLVVNLMQLFDDLKCALTNHCLLGLSGGIIQVPAECKSREQKNGTGVTIYHFVESIEDVSFSHHSSLVSDFMLFANTR